MVSSNLFGSSAFRSGIDGRLGRTIDTYYSYTSIFILLPPWQCGDTNWVGRQTCVSHPPLGARKIVTPWQCGGTNWVAHQPCASPLPVEVLDSPLTVSVAHHSSPQQSAYCPPLGARKFATPWQYVQQSLVEYQPCVCLWPVGVLRTRHRFLIACLLLLPVVVRTPCASPLPVEVLV